MILEMLKIVGTALLLLGAIVVIYFASIHRYLWRKNHLKKLENELEVARLTIADRDAEILDLKAKKTRAKKVETPPEMKPHPKKSAATPDAKKENR
jgi:hypothetical protein